MTVYNYIAIILTLAILISYVNHRFIKLQTTIAMMLAAVILSLIVGYFNHSSTVDVHHHIRDFIINMDFHKLVMQFMLGLLLFAGALTINLSHLNKLKWDISILALFSTVISAFLIAIILYFILKAFGFDFKFVYCFLFGSLISPTDPIAVLAIFKEVGAPKQLETAVAAEALFNDGVGVVLFITAYYIAFTGTTPTVGSTVLLFLREAVGGIVYGLVFGFFLCWLIKPLAEHKIQIMLTITLVIGAYSLAQSLEISGPLAMVTAGIIMANFKREAVMSKTSRHYLEIFWEMIDELLNTILFLLLGFEILIISYSWAKLLLVVITIVVVLLVRFITVAIPMAAISPWREKIPFKITILTWGGLRGGLAVALALALPHGDVRSSILSLTYGVVLFSILVQGTTIKPLVKLTRSHGGEVEN